MSVSWFTGTVAYLPSSRNSSTLSTSTRAIIAGKAWAQANARPPSDDSDSEDFPDDNGEAQPRDLWEEKHYAALGRMGKEAEIKILPDWKSVDLREGQGSEVCIPSFWAAEVEELPRGADIEWAALSGVVGGVKVRDF